jgi:hypothetical protein
MCGKYNFQNSILEWILGIQLGSSHLPSHGASLPVNLTLSRQDNRLEHVALENRGGREHVFISVQVDKDTMEMLNQMGMGSLPGVTVQSVRAVHNSRCLHWMRFFVDHAVGRGHRVGISADSAIYE